MCVCVYTHTHTHAHTPRTHTHIVPHPSVAKDIGEEHLRHVLRLLSLVVCRGALDRFGLV